MLRVPYDDLYDALVRAHRNLGFSEDRAERSARLFAETTRDGVYSHGLNRFPRLVEMIRAGHVDVKAEPVCTSRLGALEQWDGRLGPGNLNAETSMARAVALSREHGVGCVALCNTNHWMRGGSYGWQAAEAGAIGVCWTNTMPNLPPWGARDCRLGNNPLIIAVPRPGGHVVLDMALSQFSYGKLEEYRRRGRTLPADGGFDADGALTRDPAAIEAAERPLPVGLWKGAGLSLLLDLAAALLSGGRATYQIGRDPLAEHGVSQAFVAFDLTRLGDPAAQTRLVDEALAFVRDAAPAEGVDHVYYPGEQTLARRAENTAEGVPVVPDVWAMLQDV